MPQASTAVDFIQGSVHNPALHKITDIIKELHLLGFDVEVTSVSRDSDHPDFDVFLPVVKIVAEIPQEEV